MGRHLVRWASLVAAVALLGACEGPEGPTGPQGAEGPTGPTGPAGPQGDPGLENFLATLNGANEVPPNTSEASGTARISLIGPNLLYRVDVANITGVTAAHIHGPAAAGENAGVRVDLCGTANSPACASGTVNGVLALGAATRVNGISFDSLLVLMRNGNAYVNVHTSALPGGEIRGQIATQ